MNEPLDAIERLFAGMGTSPEEWMDAEFPPGTDPPRGRVEFVFPARGGLILRVPRSQYEGLDYQLSLLFATGSYVFSSANDLHSFVNGPLADAFGIRVTVGVATPGLENPAAADRGVSVPDVLERRAAEQVRRREVRECHVTCDDLAERLAQRIHGQDAALERVAHVVTTQFAKRSPGRPGTVMLIGPPGSGKTTTVESLPGALDELGCRGSHVFRVDCNEMSEEFHVTRLLGAPPGYVGHVAEPPLAAALAQPRCIVLLDEVDRAHPAIVGSALLNFLDSGAVTTPTGARIDGSHSVIALTSNQAADDLAAALHTIPSGDRWRTQQTCRRVLTEVGVAAELLDRISAFAVFWPLGQDAEKAATLNAIIDLAAEYRLEAVEIEPVLLSVIHDIAGTDTSGARSLYFAARELLGDALAEASYRGVRGRVSLSAGPPVCVETLV